jgi:UDP-N-acetylglucosamine--N-acetylmuramyl-(pentapeptide) pyrophosphoryl-undecaprenol N-acetylglucosamine transferase
MAAADLIVARAGANTVAEIAAIGRASILVPFPHAADDHQAKNAMSLAELGGAVCVRQEDASVARLATELAMLFEDGGLRTRMAAIAREHGRPHAAADIARDLLAVAGIALRASGARVDPPKTNGSSVRTRTAKEIN